MEQYTEQEAHSFDRALLAVVTAQPTPYSKQTITDHLAGRQFFGVNLGARPHAVSDLPDSWKDGESRVIVSVPTDHPLMDAKTNSCLNPVHIDIPGFNSALVGRYHLAESDVSMLSCIGIKDDTKGDSYKRPPEMLLLIKPEGLKKLAVKALEKLSDPAKATSILELEHGHEALPYATQIKDPDSNLTEMVQAIYHNGGFEKGDKDIARIMEEANRIENYEFTIWLRALDDPSKAKKPLTERATAPSTPGISP